MCFGNNCNAGVKMKKFTKILICLMLCFVPFVFMACGDKGNTFNYDKDAVVYGNGGLAVTKGNYIYFVNGYKSLEDDITDANRYDKYTVGSLMVAVLDNGRLSLDEDGYIQDEYCKVMSDTLVGYEITDLYIVGDYLYFATPVVEAAADSSGEFTWDKTMVDIARVHLGRPNQVERVYRAGVSYDSMEYHCYEVNGHAYIVVYEKSDEDNSLVCYDVDNKKTNKITDVTSVSLSENSVHYVQEDSENGTNYYLYSLNLANNESTRINGYTTTNKIELVECTDKFIYAKITENNKTSLYYNKGGNFVRIVNTEVADNIYINSEDNYVVLVTYGDGGETYNMIEYVDLNKNDFTITELYTDNDATSIIKIIGEYFGSIVYTYTAESNTVIKSISVANAIAGNKVEPITIVSAENIVADMFDVDNGFVYYFKTSGESNANEYLFRASIRENASEELIGKLNANDLPSEE